MIRGLLVVSAAVLLAGARADDRASLMDLYTSTNGGSWVNSAGWGTTGSFCGWFGVACDGAGRVTTL
jgi:hypothetical protein